MLCSLTVIASPAETQTELASCGRWQEVLLEEVLPEMDTAGGRATPDRAFLETQSACPGEGQYYSNARWYDPETGRFLTEDPARDGENWYAYVGNNPMTFVDPNGLETQTAKELRQEFDRFSREERYTGSFEGWASQRGYSSSAGNNGTTYYYKSADWSKGGDVISQGGSSYIQHAGSYTLVNTTTGAAHSFAHPYDPQGVLSDTRLSTEVARATEELVFRYHIQDQANALYINQGYREPAEQQAVFESGASLARPWESWHQYGLAVDVVFQNASGGPSWAGAKPWQSLGAVGQQVGMVWGGSWPSFPDRPHYQMTGALGSPAQARSIYVGSFDTITSAELSTLQTPAESSGLAEVWEAAGLR